MDANLTMIEQVIQDGPFRDDGDSLGGFKVPGWFRSAKFGIRFTVCG